MVEQKAKLTEINHKRIFTPENHTPEVKPFSRGSLSEWNATATKVDRPYLVTAKGFFGIMEHCVSRNKTPNVPSHTHTHTKTTKRLGATRNCTASLIWLIFGISIAPQRSTAKRLRAFGGRSFSL